MLKNNKRVNASGDDSYCFPRPQLNVDLETRTHLDMEEVAGGKLPHVDTSGMNVLGGIWVSVGWYSSGRRLVRAGTGRMGGCSWEPRAEPCGIMHIDKGF